MHKASKGNRTMQLSATEVLHGQQSPTCMAGRCSVCQNKKDSCNLSRACTCLSKGSTYALAIVGFCSTLRSRHLQSSQSLRMIAKPGDLRFGLGCACRMRLCGLKWAEATHCLIRSVTSACATRHVMVKLTKCIESLQDKRSRWFPDHLRAFAFDPTAFVGVCSRSKNALMQKQQKRRVFGQQVPWQVSVGVAFAVTVICCAKRRRNKGRRERGARTKASPAFTEQVR